jgi:hypothetical protein
MPAFTMRLDEKLTSALDSLFPLYGYRSRNHFLEGLAQEAAQRGFVPTYVGEGYRAIAPGGGVLSLMRQLDLVASGSRGLTAEEAAIYEQAKQLAEQGDWLYARNLLQEAGFKIENVAESPAEPRPVFTS